MVSLIYEGCLVAMGPKKWSMYSAMRYESLSQSATIGRPGGMRPLSDQEHSCVFWVINIIF